MCKRIEKTIANCLRNKLNNYTPKIKEMPFHYRLIGKDRMALFSFIHSLNISFGISIFGPVALTIASERFAKAAAQYVVGNVIFDQNRQVITEILDLLRSSKSKPNKPNEIELLRKSLVGDVQIVKATKVDLYLENKDGERWLFGIKLPKLNEGNFLGFKRTLLEWAAIALSSDDKREVHSLIAFPYNPYAPKPYERWTMKGLFDFKHEIMIAEEFWDFLGGEGTYEELLNCFARVGDDMRGEIDEYFKRFILR
ncbi:MAG: TdeIII family type II restriction endonuclease [Clostridiales bacterium]|nr:TdeIII family type II restriction endonuclease [Clostridiales bacterium]